MKNLIKTLPYVFISIILAIIFIWLINYFSFYVHESGHATAAILSTLTRHNPSIEINFTYIPYPILLTSKSLLVPQQTISRLPRIMSVYGVIFTMIFYALIFMSIVFIISKIKSLRENRRIPYIILAILFLLVARDIVLNLFCGTDGLNLNCSQLFLNITYYLFLFLLLLTSGWFFIEILYLKKFSIKLRKKS